MNPQAPGIFRDVTKSVTIQDGKNELNLDVHDRLFVSLTNSGLDVSILFPHFVLDVRTKTCSLYKQPTAFPNPLEVNPDRPAADYNFFGFGMHKCMGDQFTEKVC